MTDKYSYLFVVVGPCWCVESTMERSMLWNIDSLAIAIFVVEVVILVVIILQTFFIG